MSRIKILNVKVDNLTLNESVNYIEDKIKENNNSYVVTPNVDHLVLLDKDEEFKKVYENADVILTDGMPLIWMSKLFRKPIKEKVSGSDLFPALCTMAAQKKYKIFLLGAAEGVAAIAADNLKEKYEGLEIAGTYSPKFGFEKDKDELDKIIDIVNTAKPDILAVGLGAPKQEKFIYKYKDKLNVPISLAIGATIDFEAGNIKRAPIWMQKCGLEWFYRMIKDPKRLVKRYGKDLIMLGPIIYKYRK
ncbi:MAG: WecB/TagA/CpsF family glycosyltransferase [Clostridium sp.]